MEAPHKKAKYQSRSYIASSVRQKRQNEVYERPKRNECNMPKELRGPHPFAYCHARDFTWILS